MTMKRTISVLGVVAINTFILNKAWTSEEVKEDSLIKKVNAITTQCENTVLELQKQFILKKGQEPLSSLHGNARKKVEETMRTLHDNYLNCSFPQAYKNFLTTDQSLFALRLPEILYWEAEKDDYQRRLPNGNMAILMNLGPKEWKRNPKTDEIITAGQFFWGALKWLQKHGDLNSLDSKATLEANLKLFEENVQKQYPRKPFNVYKAERSLGIKDGIDPQTSKEKAQAIINESMKRVTDPQDKNVQAHYAILMEYYN